MKEFDVALKCTRPQWSPNAPPRENLGIEWFPANKNECNAFKKKKTYFISKIYSYYMFI